MKKLLSLLLCVAMVLSLVACGGNETPATEAAKEPIGKDKAKAGAIMIKLLRSGLADGYLCRVGQV